MLLEPLNTSRRCLIAAVPRYLSAIAILVTVLSSSRSHAQVFTLMAMPDPQFYTNSTHPALYDLYGKQARWIRDNKTTYNIKHVIWLGDLTNDNTSTQWGVASSAYTILDNAGVQYAVVPGNHDYRTGNSDSWVGANLRDLTKYNNNVGPSRFSGKSWYGGNMGNTTNHNENNYTFFSSGGLNFLVIGLEYAPRKEVLTWANNLISQYPNHRVIIFTHMYLTTNGSYAGGSGSATGTVGCEGDDLFRECAGRHSNVFMVACGHVTESKVNTKTGVGGNTVYEMLVDYQGEQVKGTGDDLGNGWLRILQFNPANNTIAGSTISVDPTNSNIFTNGIAQFYNGPYSTNPSAADHLFTLSYNMTAPMAPYTYLNNALEFHDMGVKDVNTGTQLDPEIAQAANGDWAAVWEDDDDANGVYKIVVRGFDSDGNVRFTDSVVNTTGVNTTNNTNPAIAMAPDGRFVVTWQSSNTAIRVRAYNANGTAVGTGEQTAISVTSPGTVSVPDVAMADNGSFVVTWQDDADGNGVFQIRARGYAFDYTGGFAAKTINSIAAGQQKNPVIAMSGNGDYVVAWEDDQESDGSYEIACRGFLANETQRFGQFFDNATTTGQQLAPAICMDDSGRFVVAWEDDTDLNSSYQILARGFNANGTQLFTTTTVNVISTGNQLKPALAMDDFSNWYAAWLDDGAVTGGEGYQIMTNVFNISGTRVNAADVRANSVTAVTHNTATGQRSTPVISAHRSGRYIVGWADDMDGDGKYKILARGMPGAARSLVVKSVYGTVAKSPAQPFYENNAVVQLTVTPQPGYTFTGWSGNVPTGGTTSNPLSLTMNGNKSLTANYVASAQVGQWELY